MYIYSYNVRDPGYTLESRKLENGSWKSEVENWKLKIGSQKTFEVERRKLFKIWKSEAGSRNSERRKLEARTRKMDWKSEFESRKLKSEGPTRLSSFVHMHVIDYHDFLLLMFLIIARPVA